MALTRRFMSRLLLLVLMGGLIAISTAVQGTAVTPAVPGADDRCPVCGMAVQPHQDWLTQVRFDDGSTLFFEGPKDMFRYLHSPHSYARDKAELEIVATFVTTWGDQRTIPLERAWFVIGSDVKGPAGEELVALGSIEEANKFIIEHGGTRLCEAGDVSPSVLAQLP